MNTALFVTEVRADGKKKLTSFRLSGVFDRISFQEVPIQSSTHCDVKPVGIFPTIRFVDV